MNELTYETPVHRFAPQYWPVGNGSSSSRTRIENDDRMLTIQIDGIHNGRTVHYHQSLNIADMHYWQREWLTYQAFASVGVALPVQEMMGLILTVVGLLFFMLTGFFCTFTITKVGGYALRGPAL